MIYDAVEQAYIVVNANFDADLTALIAAKGVTGISATATKVKRQPAETFVRLGAILPAIGIYAALNGLTATTQAKDQGKRDTTTTIVLDYFAVGADPIALSKQAELAVEALLRSIDRLWSSGGGVFGAGEAVGSVTIQLDDGYNETKSPNYEHRGRVTFPLIDRDEGL